MSEINTLFVIGAGASQEVGLPTGEKLMAEIAGKIDIKFDDFGNRQISGDTQIRAALDEHVREEDGRQGDINPYLYAGWHIRDAMPQALSIDSFIDSQEDEKISLCGKLAIVRSILEAEERSLLYFEDNRRDSNIDFANLAGTWFDRFLKLLTEGCKKEDLKNKLQGIAFIIFNYDRCVEHFLFHALKNYYRIDDFEASEILQELNVFHPYGVVGHLPWQKNHEATAFGKNTGGEKLLFQANQIKTFSERIEDEASTTKMRKFVLNSDTIVFLGFAFHKPNMKLLQPEKPGIAKKVFGTVMGISQSDRKIVEGDIVNLIQPQSSKFEANLRDISCGSLFDEYWRSFAF